MIYEYKCERCKRVTERLTKDSHMRYIVCPVCRGAAERQPSAPNFVLKGNDYKKGK